MEKNENFQGQHELCGISHTLCVLIVVHRAKQWKLRAILSIAFRRDSDFCFSSALHCFMS